MPHTVLRTVAGVHGGALVIVGLGYAAMGLAWMLAPLVSLHEGVSWVPHGAVNQDSVGLLWILSGVFILATGMFSKGHKRWESAGYVVAIAMPSLVVIWFLSAALVVRAGIWLIAAVMLAWPTVFIAWIGVRVKDDVTHELREVP